MEDEDIEEGIRSVDTISSNAAGVETPGVIDLRKSQRKEPHKVLEQKEERIATGTLFPSIHTYGLDAQDKSSSSGAKRVDLLKNQRSEKVDVTIHPEELEAMDDVLATKYEEAREEEKLGHQKEDFSDMVAENLSKRKKKHDKEGSASSSSKKKKYFKF